MSENNITIYQTLHGYSNGHHLLESSILLSDESKRKMDILSDLSGGDIAEEFNFYYSGYYLENEDMIVFAKTWYALEMPRPGCVWTHSLLIPVKNIYSCSLNIEGILNLFKRPIINDVQTDYSESFSIDLYNASIFEFDDKKIQYLIWVMLGQTPPNCIISKDSEDFVKELLFVWFVCYNELSYDYSFITGMSVAKKDSKN